MSRRRFARPVGPTDEEREAALATARAMLWYGFCAHVEPPYTREQINSMSAGDIRAVLDEFPDLPSRLWVEKHLPAAEGRDAEVEA